MNLSEVIAFIYGEEKALTAMKTVKQGTAKIQLYYTFLMVYCCGVASVSKSAFIYFQCNADKKTSYILL